MGIISCGLVRIICSFRATAVITRNNLIDRLQLQLQHELILAVLTTKYSILEIQIRAQKSQSEVSVEWCGHGEAMERPWSTSL